MSGATPIREEELHAYIDGELPAARADDVAAALAADPALAARVAAFAADKAALAAAYRPIGRAPVPLAWIARVHRATAPAPRRYAWIAALAACVVLALGGVTLLQRHALQDPILRDADAARQDRSIPRARLTGAALAVAPARDALLARTVGLPVHAPDLTRLGWRLTELDTYDSAAAMRYRAADGRALTLFVRRSQGAAKFDLYKTGTMYTCIWQDEVVGAVMMGDMTAGQMMRVASTAYVALNL
jgi:anti-sigma factor RsiW